MGFDFRAAFERALPYKPFVQQYGTQPQQGRWQEMYDQVRLTASQKALLGGFQRRMNVLALAGVWCGDCVHACPIWQRFAEASPAIDLRFIDRPGRFDPEDPSPDTALALELSICGAPRVPVMVFLSEDWYECERFGERSLATYRAKVAKMEGLTCPIGVSPPDDVLQASIDEWLTHFERVQLMLLTSPRLMQMHEAR